MEQQKKRIIFALVIIFAFAGSSVALAFDSAMQFVTGNSKQTQPDEVDRPLADSEEAPYLQNNYLIVRYYYSANCPNCARAEDAISGLRSELAPILLERISVDEFANETESMGLTQIPSVYLKGSSTMMFSGAPTYDRLFTEACRLYFDPPMACPI
ncbi:MAG: hypothetical protein V1887_03200 [Candidatus Aenigmatarchaeota archaeon]